MKMKKLKAPHLGLIPIMVVVVLTIAMSEMFYQNMMESATESCWEEMAMAHNEAASKIGVQLSNNINMLDLTSGAVVLHADFEDKETVRAYLADVQPETIFDRIDVMYPDGTVLVQNGDRVSSSGEQLFQDMIALGSRWSQRVKDYHTGEETIYACSPVYDASGNPIAVLGGTLYCSTMAELFTSSHYGDNARLFLIDLRDGKLVLDKWHGELGSIYDMRGYEIPEEYSGGDFTANIMAGGTGSLAYFSPQRGNNSYMYYGPIQNTNLSLAMVVQEDVLFAAVSEVNRTMRLVGIIEVALLLMFALFIYVVMGKALENESRAQRAELALLQQKERRLESQYALATNRREFLELMAVNLPGGYHRCTTDHEFKLTFVSNSFTQITGYTLEQVQEELGGSYMGLVAPEDREYFLSLAPQLERDGQIYCGYRMRRRDGVIRWVKDATQYVEHDGEAYYQCALMDFTEQIEEIERAKQVAEASSQAKSTFLFNISHDIRTPMNAIKGFSHIIEENPEEPQLVKETIAKINQASDSLMMLMNDVLDIARIERGKEDINLQPIDLYEHGKNLYQMFAADMEAAGIRFESEGDVVGEYVYGDPLKLTRILMNMLSNAKKFTPPGGTVTFGGVRLHSDEENCTYRFFVRDTGIGMSQEFMKRAFDQFERERTSTESGISGSGLGLAIIKRLADLMGGTVEIQSELGRGTEISVTFAFKRAQREQTGQESKEVQRAQDMKGRRILLVEDNDFNREIARYILEGMELEVEEAENGSVCIEKLMSARPDYYDLILMDIQMPVMDGYTATVEIRNLADQQRASIPIVAMTANAFEEDRQHCLDVGMNGHIGKPVDMEALKQVLGEVIP